MKAFQKPTQYGDSKHLFFQRPINRSVKDMEGKDDCFLFGIQSTLNTFKNQHMYSFKAAK